MKAYVDGSCRGNGQRPNAPGGWAVVFEDGQEFSGHLTGTTNNLAELAAVENAVHLFRPEMTKLVVVTDSQNVIGWLSQGWHMKPHIKAAVKIVKDLIAAMAVPIEFEKVEGHAGFLLNERADRLAFKAASQ